MATIDEEVKTKFMNDKHRFITNMVFTTTWFQNKFVDFIKPFGISPQQFNILRILRGAKGWVAMNDIKDLMIDKAPNVTRLSDKLLDKNLVLRKRSESDRRVVSLEITKEGLALLKSIDDCPDTSHMDFMNRITEEEAKMFSDILDKMRA